MTVERRPPRAAGFVELPFPAGSHARAVLKQDAMRSAFSRWRSGPIIVISALEDAQLPGAPEGTTGPQWHISISCDGKRRPKPHHIRRALRAFDMVGAEIDNHHPGLAQHFWKPLDPAYRTNCECKETEATITEPDGYTWTNPHPETGEECRGCEYARAFGRPCSIHGKYEKTEQLR